MLPRVKRLVIFVSLIGLLASPILVSAQERQGDRGESDTTTREELRSALRSVRTAQTEQERLQRLRDYLEQLISRRIEMLQRAQDRINSNLNLTEEEKTKILQKIDQSITRLEELRSQAVAQENVEWLRQQIRELGHGHRVFQEVLPYARFHALLGKLRAVLNRMRAIERKINQTIDSAQAQGLAVAELEESAAEYQRHLNKTQTEIDSLKLFIEALSASSDDPKEVFEQAKERIRAAHSALKEARKSLRKIHAALKELREATKLKGPATPTSTGT